MLNLRLADCEMAREALRRATAGRAISFAFVDKLTPVLVEASGAWCVEFVAIFPAKFCRGLAPKKKNGEKNSCEVSCSTISTRSRLMPRKASLLNVEWAMAYGSRLNDKATRPPPGCCFNNTGGRGQRQGECLVMPGIQFSFRKNI